MSFDFILLEENSIKKTPSNLEFSFLGKKMKVRDLKLLVQCHTARKWKCWSQVHNHGNLTWKYRSGSDPEAHSQPDLAHKYIVLLGGANSKDHRLDSTTKT